MLNIYRRFEGKQWFDFQCRQLNLKDQGTALFRKFVRYFPTQWRNIWECSNRLRHRCEKLKPRVTWHSHSCFRFGFCTTSKVRTTHTPLNRKKCSTGLQRTGGTATFRPRTIGGCTMTNESNRTPNLITILRPTRRRRQVAGLPYCYWLLDIVVFCTDQFVMPRSCGSWRDVLSSDIVYSTSA